MKCILAVTEEYADVFVYRERVIEMEHLPRAGERLFSERDDDYHPFSEMGLLINRVSYCIDSGIPYLWASDGDCSGDVFDWREEESMYWDGFRSEITSKKTGKILMGPQ